MSRLNFGWSDLWKSQTPAQSADAGRVKWFGPATRKQAAEFYRNADVFILPTLSDGFAITQLEAQAHGLPVIASKNCGKVVENGVNGIILDEPSAACIAHAVRDCIAIRTVWKSLRPRQVYVMNSQSTDLLSSYKSSVQPCRKLLNLPKAAKVPCSGRVNTDLRTSRVNSFFIADLPSLASRLGQGERTTCRAVAQREGGR